MPPRLNRPLAGAALAALSVALLPGCVGSGCHITTHCEGDTLHFCDVDYDSGSVELATNCAADGRVCRESGASADCVYADRPCAVDACAGDQIASCTALGLVGSYFDCTHDEPGRTCFDGTAGPSCGYPAITCPSSGASTLCGPDGVSLYSGCGSEAHPFNRYDCSSYSANVCATANGLAGCALPGLVSCTLNEDFCSADLTIAYGCGVIGLVSRADDCAARGQICRAGWCGFDLPCDPALTDSWCSDDGSTLYSCASNGLASARATCAAGKRCTERTAAGRTFAGCE
jgi:hypothetical protein